jgi:hypothetical protein
MLKKSDQVENFAAMQRVLDWGGFSHVGNCMDKMPGYGHVPD